MTLYAIEKIRPNYHSFNFKCLFADVSDRSTTLGSSSLPSNRHLRSDFEFPFYQGLLYFIFLITGPSIPLARFVTILLTVVSTFGIYKITSKLTDNRIGLASAIAFTLFPSSLFWGRSISPDVMALMLCIVSWWILLGSTTKSRWWLASIAWAGAVLIKPYYLVFGISYVYFFAEYTFQLAQHKTIPWKNMIVEVVKFSIIPVVLYVAWRLWAGTFPAYTIDPDPAYILHAHQGWWAYWHSSDWLSVLVTRHLFGELITPLGGMLAVVGISKLFAYQHLHRRLLLSWLLVPLVISTIFAWGSWQHDYYLLPWLMGLSVVVGIGSVIIWDYTAQLWTHKLSQFDLIWRSSLLILLIFFAYFWGVKKFADYHAGFFSAQGYVLSTPSFEKDYQELEKIIPQDATVISILKDRDPYPLTAIKRTGNIMKVSAVDECPNWFNVLEEVKKLRQIRASYVIVHAATATGDTCPREYVTGLLAERNELIYQGNQFVAFKLNQPKLSIRGDENQITITAHYLGDQPILEAGGIPGTDRATEIYPEWEEVDQFTRVVTIDASTWLSFHTFWQAPELTVETSNWYIDDNEWLVKR